MRDELLNSIIKKLVATIFATATVLFGVYFGAGCGETVYAADLKLHQESGNFYYVEYNDKSIVASYVGNQTFVTEAGSVEGCVFAGWFEDVDCTKPISSKTQVKNSTATTFYAKYLAEEVLSTKVQISKGDVNDSLDGIQRNMRFVSSVDNVNFKSVGFALKYKEIGSNDWKPYKTEGQIVFSKIKAVTEVDEYKYSPKVVNTKSEYFMTAIWKGAPDENGQTSGLIDDTSDAAKTNFDTNYYVRAYWKTLDGVTVYGPTRYVSVNDGLNTNIVNVSVKKSDWETKNNLTVSSTADGVTATVSELFNDGTYAHLKIDLGTGVNRTQVLKSVTKFTITNSAGGATATSYYRNLETKYTGTGTEDRSWLTVYGVNNKEYVIATAADLYGLASIVNASTDKDYRYYFADQKIYVVADIEVNKGRATSTAWSMTDEDGSAIEGATEHSWTGIGTSASQVFKGVFDGQGHTISGINGTNGLFKTSVSTTKIKNFRLENSYLVPPQNGSGSIVSLAYGGTIENVYSEAFINNASRFWVGGIVGVQNLADTTLTIKNCWYAGTFTTAKAAAGGILGKNTAGTTNITNCQSTGQITTTVDQVGGIVGTSAATLTIKDCLFDGTINLNFSATGNKKIGGLVGQNEATGTLSLENCLNSGEFANVGSASPSGVCRIVGTNLTENMTLTNVYFTKEGFNSTTDFYNNITGSTKTKAQYGTYLAVDVSDITGMCAYYNDILVKTDAWVVTKTTPQLALFGEELTVPENANIDWFTGFEETEYTICDEDTNEKNVAELNGFAFLSNAGIDFDGMTITLGNDVVLNEEIISELTEEERAELDAWTPIGSIVKPFKGTFDGKDAETGEIHSISGLYATSDSNGLGLFTATAEGSTVQNLKVLNSYFENTTSYTGSIVGLCEGNIANVYSEATVKGKLYTGGLIGRIYTTSAEEINVNNCWFAGNLKATDNQAGGIVGAVDGGTVKMTDCLNTADIVCSGAKSAFDGGICGGMTEESPYVVDVTMTNCLNVGKLTNCNTAETSFVGAVLGRKNGNAAVSATNVYGTYESYAKAVGGTSIPSGFTMVNESDITGLFAYYNNVLVKTDTWVVTKTTPQLALFGEELTVPENANIDWFTGFEETEYTICDEDTNEKNVAELNGFAFLSNAGIDFDGMTITLGNDVVLNEEIISELTEEERAELDAWTPIGSIEKPFKGTFDGKDAETGEIHSISGLYATSDSNGLGLFAATAEGSAVQNLKVLNSYFENTTSYTGSIVGLCEGSLANVYSEATVKGKLYTGGLIGRIYTTSAEEINVNNCWFAGNLKATDNQAGGIVGAVDGGTVKMTDCLNTADIVCSGAKSAFDGGICGGMTEETGYVVDVTMTNCLNVGKLTNCNTAETSFVGAVLGRKNGNAAVSATNVYGTYESYAKAVGGTSIPSGFTMVNETDITGAFAYYNNILVNEDAWVATETTPELAMFSNTDFVIPEVSGDVDFSWYEGSEITEYTICDEATNAENVAELKGFAHLVNNVGVTFDGVTITLGNDVVLNGQNISELTEEERAELDAWTPIGTTEKPFEGTFDGNDAETGEIHSISGLYATSDSNGMGLFAATAEGSAVQNLKVLNSYFENTTSYTGSIVGLCEGSLANVYSEATVKGKLYTGGLIGRIYTTSAEDININNCWFAGNLEATGNQEGGIVGAVDGGTVKMTDCLNTADIVCSGANSAFNGGICGGMTEETGYVVDVTMTNCLNVGKLTNCNTAETSFVGAVLGRKNGNAAVSATNVYGTSESYAKAVGGTSIPSGFTMVNESDITGTKAYYNIDFVRGDVWAITATTPELEAFSTAKVDDPNLEGKNIDWYTGLVDSTFTICAEEDDTDTRVDKLYGFAFLVDQGINFKRKTVNLGADVAVNEGTVYDEWDKANGTYNGDALTTWNPIGAETLPFAGTFNGNNKTISGLYTTGTTFLGLFARVDAGGMIQNLELRDSYFSGTGSMGSVVGRLEGNIDTVYSNADVASTGSLNGGIAGYKSTATQSTITNCWYAGTISMGTAANYTGGIIGRLIQNADLVMRDCLFSGTISVAGAQRNARIGGFVGNTVKTLAIYNSLNSGEIVLETATNMFSTCRVIGEITAAETADVTIDSVYYTEKGFNPTVSWNRPKTTQDDGSQIYLSKVSGTPISVKEADIAGIDAFYYTNLDFEAEKGWALVTEAVNGADGTPVLKSFVDASEVPALPEVPENADIKWFKGLGVNTYTICNSETDNAANVKELYGFEYLVNDMGIDFSGKTVSMQHDVVVNGDWKATETPETPANTWTPIGTDAIPFAGTFNGNGNTIDGLFVDGSHDFVGFFATTGYYSTIKDFRIVNSYFNQQITGNANAGFTSSVAGELRGKMSGVYSNAIVKSGNNCIGGLAARVKTNSGFTTTIDISNCWFDGKIFSGDTGRYTGGIVGTAVRGTCNIENVLFTGTIESNFSDLENSAYIAGIVADGKANGMTLNLTSVVSAGHIVGNHNFGVVHSVIGRVRQGANQNPVLTFSNVFATRDCCETTYSVGTDETIPEVAVTGTVLQTTGDDRLIGYGTVENSDAALTFGDAAWSMRTDGVPVPTSLKDMAANVIASPDAAAMAAEIGLTYWNSEASIKDAKDSGGGNYLVSYEATDDTYNEYIAMLAKAVDQGGLGFTLYADNSGENGTTSDMNADGVYAATYYREATATTGEWVLNITYVKKESKIYISINTDLDSRDDNQVSAEQDGTNAISLSMLEMVNTHDDNPYGNSFVFELPNGHFIVNDGGRAEDGAKLLEYLKDQAGKTNGVQNPVYIDAWIISHYHDDHCGALGGFYEDELSSYGVLSGSDLRKDIYLKAVYACEPNSYALDYWDTQLGVMNKALKGAMTLTQAPDTMEQPEVYQLHMGQRYYFNGITMDVIDTQEQHPVATWGKDSEGNDLPDAFNTSSTNCLFTFVDASKATKKVLIGGDATTVNMEYIMEVYGTENQTLSNVDVFAAYHHGHNTTATFADGTVSAKFTNSLGITITVNAAIQGTANYEWAHFLLNNQDDKGTLDAVLFPYNQIYAMTVYQSGSTLGGTAEYYYKGMDTNTTYPYNIGEINNYMANTRYSAAAYSYKNGTVKITFDGSNTTKVFGKGNFIESNISN